MNQFMKNSRTIRSVHAFTRLCLISLTVLVLKMWLFIQLKLQAFKLSSLKFQWILTHPRSKCVIRIHACAYVHFCVSGFNMCDCKREYIMGLSGLGRSQLKLILANFHSNLQLFSNKEKQWDLKGWVFFSLWGKFTRRGRDFLFLEKYI